MSNRNDQYEHDRDEVLKHISSMFSPILEAVNEAWERDKQKFARTDFDEPIRVYSYGFVAGMEYQKAMEGQE